MLKYTDCSYLLTEQYYFFLCYSYLATYQFLGWINSFYNTLEHCSSAYVVLNSKLLNVPRTLGCTTVIDVGTPKLDGIMDKHICFTQFCFDRANAAQIGKDVTFNYYHYRVIITVTFVPERIVLGNLSEFFILLHARHTVTFFLQRTKIYVQLCTLFSAA